MVNESRVATRVSKPESAGPSQIDSLDGLRAAAAVMVLTTHVAFHTGLVTRPIVGPLTSRLDFGVCLFFFLSGFLLYRPWALAAQGDRPVPSVRAYLRKRWARVYPAYVVVVVVVLSWYPPSATSDVDVWVRYLTFTQIYAPGYERQGLTQMWSLALEVAFYLALPIIAHVATRRRGQRSVVRQSAVLGAMVLVAVAFNVLRAWTDWLPDDIAGYWLPAHLDWFAGGMLLALVSVSVAGDQPRPRWFDRLTGLAGDWGTWLIVAGCAFLLAATPLAGPLTPFDPDFAWYTTGPWHVVIKPLLYGVCAFALMVPLTLESAANPYARALSGPGIRWLGRISYGIFLWHLVLLGAISSALGIAVFSGWFWLLWPLTLASTVAVAWVSWSLLERRLIRWSTRNRPSPGVHRPT